MDTGKGDILLDFSKNLINEDVMKLLFQLVKYILTIIHVDHMSCVMSTYMYYHLPMTNIISLVHCLSVSWRTHTRFFHILSRNYLRTKVTPDFHLTYSKIEKIWGGNRNDKNG